MDRGWLVVVALCGCRPQTTVSQPAPVPTPQAPAPSALEVIKQVGQDHAQLIVFAAGEASLAPEHLRKLRQLLDLPRSEGFVIHANASTSEPSTLAQARANSVYQQLLSMGMLSSRIQIDNAAIPVTAAGPWAVVTTRPVAAFGSDGDGDGVGDLRDACPQQPANQEHQSFDGCPFPPPPPRISIFGLPTQEISFAPTSALLTKDAKSYLAAIAELMGQSRLASYDLQVTAFVASNEPVKLATRRAQAVVDNLVTQAIDPTRIAVSFRRHKGPKPSYVHVYALARDDDDDRVRNGLDQCPERQENLNGVDDGDGCPEPACPTQEPTYTATIDVYTYTADHYTACGALQLQLVANKLRNNPAMPVAVVAHPAVGETSPRGLHDARAKALARELVARGVAVNRVSVYQQPAPLGPSRDVAALEIVFGDPCPGDGTCTIPDTDSDGILDPVDKCPMQPETYNGMHDADGCPG